MHVVNEKDVDRFTPINPIAKVFLIDLKGFNRGKDKVDINFKNPKTGKLQTISNDGKGKIAIYNLDKTRENALKSFISSITKYPPYDIVTPNQVQILTSFFERNGKGLMIKTLGEDEKLIPINRNKREFAILDERKTKIRRASFILPDTEFKFKNGEVKKIGKEGAYLLKGEKDKPSEILSVDEFENNFISNDKKRANNLIKVAIHSTHEQSMELAKKFQEEFNFHEKGLTSDIKEPKEFDRGFVAFIEDIGARKEQVERESTEVVYTISNQGAYSRGREEVFESLRYSAVKNGAMDNNFYANFTEGGLKKEKENIIYRLEAQDLYPELRKKQAQQRF